MLGVIVNTVAVIIGCFAGLLLKKGISQKVSTAVMIGIGLCTTYLGIDGALVGEQTLVLIISMVLGAAIGTALDIDGRLNRLNDIVEAKMKDSGKQTSLVNAAVTASLLFCVGSLSIVGPINAGLTGDNELLFTKSLMDMISAAMLSVSLGVGVMGAAAVVLVYEGIIALLAGVLAPILPDYVINEMTCAGSLLIVALGLNLIGATKIKVANYLPAIIIAPIGAGIAHLLGA